MALARETWLQRADGFVALQGRERRNERESAFIRFRSADLRARGRSATFYATSDGPRPREGPEVFGT